jgi:bifunctional non-homologous end joining protein LigD
MAKKLTTHTLGFVEPMQCLAVAKLPEGSDWDYEIKFDGYRALGTKVGGQVQLLSRNGNDFSTRYPLVARALSKLPEGTVIDGEIVALDEKGLPSFNVLQNYNHSGRRLQFYVFDLLRLRGKDLRASALSERRELLRSKVMPHLDGEIVLMSDSLEATASEVVAAVRKQGLEGVIAAATASTRLGAARARG